MRKSDDQEIAVATVVSVEESEAKNCGNLPAVSKSMPISYDNKRTMLYLAAFRHRSGSRFFLWADVRTARFVLTSRDTNGHSQNLITSEDLIKLIETDNRHENMVILSSDEEVRERIFPNWDMELVSADDIREVLNDALRTARERSSIDALKLLLAKVERQ